VICYNLLASHTFIRCWNAI